MTDNNTSIHINEGPVETLRLFADLIEKSEGKAHILFLPEGFRELADEIEQLLEDVIVITAQNGEEIATIEGEEATNIIKFAVEDYIKRAILYSAAHYLNQDTEQDPS